jgi:hypothetical protein
MAPSSENTKQASQKYYDANKAVIAQRRKARRQLLNQTGRPEEVNRIMDVVDTLKNEIVKVRKHCDTVAASSTSAETVVYPSTLEGVLQMLTDKKASKTHLDTIKNVFKNVLKINDFVELKNYTAMIEKLMDYKTQIGTKRVYFAGLLKVCSSYEPFKQLIGNIAYTAYNTKYESINEEYGNAREIKKAEKEVNKVDNFDQYYDYIEEHFGRGSKEFMCILLMKLRTMRDDYNLIVSDTEPENPTENYIVIESKTRDGVHNGKKIKIKSDIVTLIISEYKTAKKRGIKRVHIDGEESTIISHYVKRNKLKNGDYLLDSKTLSAYISNFNNRIGQNHITINELRKMKISTEYENFGGKGKITPDQLAELASDAGHKVSTLKSNYLFPVKDFVPATST